MKNILCYGDSNTFGQNPEFSVDMTKPFRLAFEDRWTGILAEKFEGKARIIEEGLSGRTTILNNAVELHRNGLETLPAILMSHTPIDLLIVMLGTNDLRDCFNPIPFNLYNAMDIFLSECKNPLWNLCGTDMKLLLVSPVVVENSHGSSPWPGLFNDNVASELSRKMPKIYEELARKHHVEFLNAAEYAKPSELDFAHMMPEEHHKLADAMEKKINEILF